MTENPRTVALLAELERERDGFLAGLDALGEAALDVPLVDTWDGRDLVVHVGYWSDHGADALELARSGRGDRFTYDQRETDAMNAETAAAGHGLSLDEARAREEAAFVRFRDALSALEDGLLDQRLGNGDAVEDVIRYDGADHYAEHAAHLRLPHP